MTVRQVPEDQQEPTAMAMCLLDVQEREVDWLWRGWIPARKLTVLDGDPGDVKSTLLADLAARRTKGRAMPNEPDGTMHEPCSVIFLAAEDDMEDTLKARFRGAGADLRLVHIVPDATVSFPSGIGVLATLIRDLKAGMVVIDPVEAHLDDRVDPNSNTQVRRALQPLKKLAAETGAAIVLVRHLRKTGGKALYAGAGSIGIAGLAREVLLVGRDPATGARTLACTKPSVSEMPTSLSFELRPCGNIAVVEWLGPVATVADDLTDEPGEMSAVEEACALLRVELDSGWVASKDVQRQAVDANISTSTLRRARSKLGVRSVRGSTLPMGVLWGRDLDRWYLALAEPVPDVDKGVTEAERFLASRDEEGEQHEQLLPDASQTCSSQASSVVAQGTCSTPAPMNNNSGGTCSTGDEMNNNLSNNKDPSEGMDLEVVVHVAQGIASCREGCGSGVRDGTDNTDCLPV